MNISPPPPHDTARRPPRVLFVEDRDDDVELELAVLRGGGFTALDYAVVDGPRELRAALAERRWDVVIADYRLPEFSGVDALAIVRARDPDMPFVLVSGTVGEQAAVDAMRAGANDYVLKENLTRLPAVVARELREAALRREKSRIEGEQAFFTAAQKFLADVGRAVGGTLDAEATLRESTRLAVPMLGDWAFGYLLEGRALRVVERAAADPTLRERFAALPRELAADEGAASTVVRTVTAGGALLHPRITDEDLARLAQDEPHLRALQALAPAAMIVVPLRGRSEVLGAFVFGRAARPGDDAGAPGYQERDLGLARDFAARVGLAVENGRLFAEAREGVRVRDEFLAMLGHELRNPLAPIVTALELMKLRGEPGAPPRRELVVIERQTRYLVRLVDDLLDIARVTRGKVSLDLAPVELAVAVARGVEAAGPLIEQRRHRLAVQVPGAGLLVHADEIRLAQVVANLLTNAARYTPEGGQIRVTAARESDDRVALTVADNGTGIAPELLPRLFDAFVQGHRTIDRREGGLGLGLALVRNLVELHGGSVSAHSDGPGRGSEFTVRLPALAADAERPSAAALGVRTTPVTAPPVATAGPAPRVLVVDDNVDAAEMLAAVLSGHGFEVRAVNDPFDALSQAGAFAPDAAVLDIGLPGMDGYELAVRLRAGHGAGLKLVAVTGYGQQRDHARARDAGFDAHLVKPVDVRALLDALSG